MGSAQRTWQEFMRCQLGCNAEFTFGNNVMLIDGLPAQGRIGVIFWACLKGDLVLK